MELTVSANQWIFIEKGENESSSLNKFHRYLGRISDTKGMWNVDPYRYINLRSVTQNVPSQPTMKTVWKHLSLLTRKKGERTTNLTPTLTTPLLSVTPGTPTPGVGFSPFLSTFLGPRG